MQIGNISVEQIATSLGSDPDHLVEALEEVFCAPQPTEGQDAPGQESAWLTLSYDPDDYYVNLGTSSSFSKHFNDICVITLGQMAGTTFPVTINSQVNINVKGLVIWAIRVYWVYSYQ